MVRERLARRAWPRGRATALLRWLERCVVERPTRRDREGTKCVTLLLWNQHAMGGTVTTVLRQAAALAEIGWRVSVVSVIRHQGQEAPFHEPPQGVLTEVLVDRRALASGRGPLVRLQRWLDNRPPMLSHVSLGRERFGSLLLDLCVLAFVARRRGVIVGTRAGLNLTVARFGHPRGLRVWQEHLELRQYTPDVRRALQRHGQRVHAVACLTEADAASYRELFADEGPRVTVIPNSIPDELPEASPLDEHVVVALGRLEHTKGYDLLLDAFAMCVADFPGWRLRIVGAGRRQKKLASQIERLGLQNSVDLVGARKDVEAELRSASIFVMSSRFESFGMVLVEAMSVGLGIVSFDSRNGPREILRDERNALVAPTGDVEALAFGMGRLMADPDLRRSLGTQARRDVQRFTRSRVTSQWSALFQELNQPRSSVRPARTGTSAGRDV
ncbi:MAG: glycosyltransferase family 4 protein [Nitriliruptoraceae bacterium]|nr:glycosyltransferase family 4 protein [Nitriliruptoraceae bacterium]